MRTPSLLVFTFLLFSATTLSAQTATAAKADSAASELTIDATPLGDNDAGVVMRVSLRLRVSDTLPAETPLVVQGSILQQERVLRNFRYEVPSDRRDKFSFIQTFAVGSGTVEARLLIPFEAEAAPMLLTKDSKTFDVVKTNKPYIASAEDGAEGIIAEGAVPEVTGAVKIVPPRRDLALNLFTVEVQTKPPVERVEFYVEGKKIFTKNSPPFRTELDLGRLPKRVEVKVIGYDHSGRYVDADAWLVNERETPLEVKITRTVTPDDVSHFKLSVQNPKNLELKTVELYAGDVKLFDWKRPPYAVDIPNARLKGVEFVRASVVDETNYEASDLSYLDGSRYMEEIEVNLVELPVSVVDAAGNPVSTLKKEDFKVFEDKKPQKITSFGFSSDLPISVGVLVDHSGSMQPRIEQARSAAISFFRDILTPRDRGFFGAFSFDPSAFTPFVNDANALAAQASAMPAAEGGTALYDAIVSGLYRFRTVSGRKALIIVTDGEDTTSRLNYEDMLQYVRSARVPLYFIGIALSSLDFSANSKMKSLAAETGGVVYFVKDVKDLPDAYHQLEKELRSQYLVSYYTQSGKNDAKYRTVEVEVGQPGLKVRTIRGFIP
ncbi:MAG: VWA domain-containing protein [Acidobacteriota bacterium]